MCQGTATAFIPSRLWHVPLLSGPDHPRDLPQGAQFYVRPRYRSERALDSTLSKVAAGTDRFLNEKYAEEISAILAEWSAALLRSPGEKDAIAKILAPTFHGFSLQHFESRVTRSSLGLKVLTKSFNSAADVDQNEFVRQWTAWFESFSKVEVAEFQVTRIESANAPDSNARPSSLHTDVRYEIVGSGPGFFRRQRVGTWKMSWESPNHGAFQLKALEPVEETEATSTSPFFADISASALARNSSYSEQMLHGSDYWRTVIDGACGIDVYGHNGVSVADIDGDGFDDLYVCQPAGLPNRLYRNRGDGTFEDITEASGLGILENTACALFADFNNNGHQDVIIVRANGPLLLLNDGGGKFREKKGAFQFANPPQGAFAGAAVADYDRDGWLDIYFCLYSYYQGTSQYRYPSPYQTAENGPPNFLMRNNGDGTFRDVTAESGLSKNNTRYSFCCAWNDFNHDGWPDLYVVNDFGRKNLYRNNGDGTFTDIAPETKTEDVGAGMSISWLDYDNDGADDLYVANMWTAAGMRVSAQENFKKDAPAEIRALYQKHAMGNSLLRNAGAAFAEATNSSGTGVGRWAWSSDAYDFDHDGFPDIYVANGMISGPSRTDLNSFFWRQVVANSPDQAASSREYEQGWMAINELIRADGTWSGYERNIFYANNRDGTFSDVSAVVGLDFIEDSRSFALADFDQDGRLEFVLKSRNAPQMRILKNVVKDLPPSVVFHLTGTKSNRDAVGASVTIEFASRRQTQTVRIGCGFLSQHSKALLFGLGDDKGALGAVIRWPSGLVQNLRDIPINHNVWVEEGKDPSRIEPFKSSTPQSASNVSGANAGEALPSKVATWLLLPVAAPDFSLPDLNGKPQTLSAMHGKRVLLHFWTSKSQTCISNLRALDARHDHWSSQGLQLLSMNVDEWSASSDPENPTSEDLAMLVRRERFSFPVLRGSQEMTAIYNLVYRQIFDRHRDLRLPTSFLIDEQGNIVKVYQGTLAPDQLERDFRSIPKSEAERLTRGLPFASGLSTTAIGRNHLSWGALFYQRGYLEQAEASFQQALADDPSSAEALYGIGSVYLNQNKNAAAREVFERCVKQKPDYPDTVPDAWNNLGVIATRESNVAEAIEDFKQALSINPNHLLSLNNLGNAYRLQKKWDEARSVLERALNIAPDDAEANYSLGMVYAQTEDTNKAYEYLQRALKSRPVYPEALNNLGVLYLVTQRPEQAVASFQECIRVAPAFDQAYLNLARVYVLQGARDQARELLQIVLKQHPDQAQARQMLQQLQQ